MFYKNKVLNNKKLNEIIKQTVNYKGRKSDFKRFKLSTEKPKPNSLFNILIDNKVKYF